MSDFERLKEMISKLRAKERAPGDARVLSGGTAEARLAALLTEVNETILPRRLKFQWDDSAGIQIAVANRRLQGVLAPSVGTFSELIGKPLSDPEDTVSTGLKEALLETLASAEGARIRSTHLGSDDLGSDAGIAADALMRHWALDDAEASEDAADGDALKTFVSSLGGVSTAWLSVQGEEVSDQSGAPDEIARLGDTAAYLLDAYLNGKDALYGAERGPKAFAVSSEGEGVFFGDTGEQTFFVLTSPNDLVSVVSSWRQSFG